MNGPSLRLNNGVGLPALGLGAYQSGPQETVAAVKTALAVGYRMIEAAAYMNEEQVGQGIREKGEIFDFSPTSEEIAAINGIDRAERGGPDPAEVRAQMFDLRIED